MANLGQHIGAIARELLGEPNNRLSNPREMRFGSNGSVAVNLEKGSWFDHEHDEGGNVVELIEKHVGVKNGGVGAWLTEHGFGDAPQQPLERKEIEATYDYTDENGELLFQAIRFHFLDQNGKPIIKNGKPRKTFKQRAPDGKGGWRWSLKGVRLVPYRLPELLEDLAEERSIFIAEGEKKVDCLRDMGIPATCNPMGAGKWPEGFAEIFRGGSVVILPDNDDAGRNHANLIGAALKSVADSVEVMNLPGLPPKGDVVDWVAAGGTAEQLYALTSTHARSWRPEPYTSRFGAIRFCEVESTTVRYEWLVKHLLPRQEVAMIYGATQSGKSFLALDIGGAVARGTDVFGHKARKGAVIYQAGEGGRGVVLRLKAYRKHSGLPENDDLPFVLLTKPVDLYRSRAATDDFIEELKSLRDEMVEPLELVIIDTLSRAMAGADENSHKDMSVIAENCQRIQEELQCSVLLVHHKNAEGAKPRGHTSLPAGVETTLDVTRDEATGIRTVRVAKQKDGEDGTIHQFRLHTVKVGVDDDGDAIKSCVVVPSETGTEQTKGNVRKTLPDQAKIALDTLRQAIAAFGEPPPPEWNLPFGVRVVHWHLWRECFRETTLAEANDEANRKAFARAGERLIAQHYIYRKDPYVWLASKAGTLGHSQSTDNVPSNVPECGNGEMSQEMSQDETRT